MAGQIFLTAKVIVRNGNKVLLATKIDPKYNGYYTLPGGRILPGETLAECAVRKLKEKTGLLIQVNKVVGLYESIENDSHYVMPVIDAYYVSGEPKQLSKENGLWQWFDYNRLPQPLFHGYSDLLKKYAAGDIPFWVTVKNGKIISL